MNNPFGNKIILASASPRRSFLLEQGGADFEVRISDAPECDASSGLEPKDIALKNAFEKADAVAKKFPDRVVLGADTIVVLDGETLGKPVDEGDARRMLSKLSGREHTVITAASLVCKSAGLSDTFFEESLVRFKRLNDEEISNYMGLVNVMDKAGSYGIQEHSDIIIEGVDGNVDNVMGLPCSLVKKRLDKFLLSIKNSEK